VLTATAAVKIPRWKWDVLGCEVLISCYNAVLKDTECRIKAGNQAIVGIRNDHIYQARLIYMHTWEGVKERLECLLTSWGWASRLDEWELGQTAGLPANIYE